MMAYRSRLLTILKPKGFNPLSLNPTLWALPSNSFSRTGAQFTAASSQYLSVASNAELQIGDVNVWFAGWVKRDTRVGFDSIITKGAAVGAGGEYSLFFNDVNETIVWRCRNAANSSYVDATDITALGTWTFVMAWHDATANTVNIKINDRTTVSTALSGGVYVATNAVNLGALLGMNFLNGSMDNWLFGKNNTESFTNIAAALYNSGNGLAFQDITSAQETDWGIVSGWLDNSLTADAFGSNTLTNNNGVTQAAGKVNAVAVDNDPTFFVDDATPNDNDLTQVNLANRLMYDVDAFGSGKHGWFGTNAGHQHFPWSKVLPTKYSISVWLKPNFNYNTPGATYNIWAPNTQQYFLRFEGRTIWEANDQFCMSLDGALYHLKVPFFAFSAGDLIHLAVTIDRDTDDYRIYKDGSLADTYNVAMSAPTATTTIYIGSWVMAGASWEGWIGPVLYTDDILTASEILALYNYGPQ